MCRERATAVPTVTWMTIGVEKVRCDVLPEVMLLLTLARRWTLMEVQGKQRACRWGRIMIVQVKARAKICRQMQVRG